MRNTQITIKKRAKEPEPARQYPTELARIKEALSESEEKYKLIFNSVDAVIIRLNKYGKIIDINSKVEEYYGYKREEVIGKHFTRLGLLTMKDVPKFVNNFKDFIMGKLSANHVALETRDKDGNRVNIEVNTTVIKKDGKIDGTVAVIQNVTDRRKAEESLRESEEKFASIFYHSPLSFSLSRLKDSTIIEINDSYTRNTGYTRKEVIGRKVTELNTWVNPEDRERMLKILKDEGRVSNVEFDFRVKSGEIHSMLLSAEKMNFRGDDCLLIMTVDITERKESEQLITSLLRNVQLGTYLGQDNKFQIVNPQIQQQTGLTEAQLLGTNPLDILHPDDRAKTVQNTIQMLKGQRSEPYEFRIIHQSGELRTIMEVVSSVIYRGRRAILANCMDITEHKQAEEELKASEEFNSSLLTNTPNAIFVTYPDGTIKYVNPAFEELTGFSLSDIIGIKTPYPWWPRETKDEIQASLKETTMGDGVNLGEGLKKEMTFQKKNGERFIVELNATIINKNGEREYILVTWIDITERKQAELALLDSEEKFSKAFSASATAMGITSLPDNKFVEINESFTHFTGYTREEVIGHTAAELHIWVHDKEQQRLLNTLQKGGRFFNQEFRSRTKSGEIRVGLGSAELINLGGKRHRLVAITDITERKRAEEALKESEEKFAKAFSSSGNAICITSLKDNIFLEINESFTRFTGYSHEEAIGHSGAELKLWVKTEEQKRWMDAIQKDGRAYNHEFSSRVKSGEIRIGLASAEVINIGGEECRIVVLTDITERKKAEESLRESEEKFSKVFNANINPMCIITVEGLNFIDINESFIRFSGYTREEIIGHSSFKLGLWTNKDDPIMMAKIFNEEGRLYNFEVDSRTKSGEIRSGLFSGEIVKIVDKLCIILVITDITERKRIEEALKRSEENFRHSLENSPLGIRIVNANEETVYTNQALLDIYGYSSFEESMSIPVEKRFTPESYEEHLRIIQKIARGESAPQCGETSIVRKDGKVRHLEILRKEVLWNGEKQSQLLYLDITERKQAEEKLKFTLANLEQSSARLESANKELEAFSYSVSHDLRSPLRSIDGFSQALLEDYASQIDDAGQNYLRRLRSASQKMGELIDGLLKLSRLSRSEMRRENVDLSALADEIASRLQEIQPERKVEFSISAGMTVNGDPQLLRALLENLLGNAWKFTSKAPQAKIELGAIRDDTQQTFFVKDNGAGFDMSYVDKLFGAFQRLHDVTEFPGTGIGLATVRRIINRHGGTVRAEGELGKGATFYFTLN